MFAALAAAAAIFWDVYCYLHCGIVPVALFLVNLVPVAALLGIWRVANKDDKAVVSRWERIARVFGVMVLSLGFAIGLFVQYALCTVGLRMFLTVTRPGAYGILLRENKHDYHGWLNHFPDRMPSAARNVRLYYTTPFGQGHGTFEVRYKTTSADARAVLKRIAPISFKTASNRRETEYSIAPNLEHSFRNERNDGWADLPKDFEVKIIDPELAGYGSLASHQSQGVAMSLKRCEVIYWADTPGG